MTRPIDDASAAVGIDTTGRARRGGQALLGLAKGLAERCHQVILVGAGLDGLAAGVYAVIDTDPTGGQRASAEIVERLHAEQAGKALEGLGPPFPQRSRSKGRRQGRAAVEEESAPDAKRRPPCAAPLPPTPISTPADYGKQSLAIRWLAPQLRPQEQRPEASPPFRVNTRQVGLWIAQES